MVPLKSGIILFWFDIQIKVKMVNSKKTPKIKKHRKESRKDEQKMEDSEEEHQLIQQIREEPLAAKKGLKIDPRQISNLSEEERAKIKEQHPDMNQYFCMSAREKSKFFHILNQNYRQSVKLAQPPGSAPMKKTIRFKKRFQIKPFAHQQKSQVITKKKSFMELYKAKQENKRKKLSKFRKAN